MADAMFEANVELKEGLTFEAKARNFSLLIDEPENLGGKDKGPNPIEYLLFALGGCLGIVTQFVAKEMNIKIESLKINLKGDLNPMRFMGKNFSERAGYKNINVVIDIKSNEKREKLEELIKRVEERYPISDNIRNPTPVNISVPHASARDPDHLRPRSLADPDVRLDTFRLPRSSTLGKPIQRVRGNGTRCSG